MADARAVPITPRRRVTLEEPAWQEIAHLPESERAPYVSALILAEARRAKRRKATYRVEVLREDGTLHHSERGMLARQVVARLKRAIRDLPPLSEEPEPTDIGRAILRWHRAGYSLAEIGERLGLSRERVRQLEAREIARTGGPRPKPSGRTKATRALRVVRETDGQEMVVVDGKMVERVRGR